MNIQPTHHHSNAASSCMAFCASRRDKYRELLKTGDMADGDPHKVSKGAQTLARYAQIEKETTQTIERIKQGENVTDIARELGLTAGAIFGRLRSRGLSVSIIRNQ